MSVRASLACTQKSSRKDRPYEVVLYGYGAHPAEAEVDARHMAKRHRAIPVGVPEFEVEE